MTFIFGVGSLAVISVLAALGSLLVLMLAEQA